MKSNEINWGGLFCLSSGFFGIMVVANQLLSTSENSGVFALISLALAISAVPFVFRTQSEN